MESFNAQGDLLVTVNQVIRINFESGTSKVEEEGALHFIHIKQKDTVILKHNNFLYALNKDIPIFTNTRPSDCYYGKRYVFPYGKSNKAFVFEEHIPPEMQKNVEFIFDSKNFSLIIFFFKNIQNFFSLMMDSSLNGSIMSFISMRR